MAALIHAEGSPVRDMIFKHWLSTFCYPDRTITTLLDHMHHCFGYTLRPENKTMHNLEYLNVTCLCSELKTRFYPEKIVILLSYLSIDLCVHC